MGAACCVASRDRTITNGSSNEVVLQRNIRNSPSWSFRWDNRRRVAGEDTAVSWFSDNIRSSDAMDAKSGSTIEATYASEDGSPSNSSHTLTWQKSPVSETNAERLHLADQSTSRKSPAEVGLEHTLWSIQEFFVKGSIQSPAISDPSPTKLSPSINSISSLSTSPLSSRGHLFPGTSTPSRWARRSPGHQLLRQISDSRIPSHKSSNFSISEEQSFHLPGWSNESNRGSNGGSSDSWSIPAFTELMAASHRERWSFDSDPFSFHREKIARSSSRFSCSPHIDVQTCGVCSRLLTEKSSWGTQKIIATNELAVVAVLICGHSYHAECLENMTPDINKYDPVCPVCTYGEKKTLKLSEKALKTELDLRAKIKRSRKRIVNSDQDDDSSNFDDLKDSGGFEGKGIKMVSSSSMKSSLGKPFLKRHFSFGSKGNRSLSVNLSNPIRRKGYFWSKSTKQ